MRICLMKLACCFYEIEAVKGTWLLREFERQIGSMLYERLAKSDILAHRDMD